jgi:hypothetical protein
MATSKKICIATLELAVLKTMFGSYEACAQELTSRDPAFEIVTSHSGTISPLYRTSSKVQSSSAGFEDRKFSTCSRIKSRFSK